MTKALSQECADLIAAVDAEATRQIEAMQTVIDAARVYITTNSDERSLMAAETALANSLAAFDASANA